MAATTHEFNSRVGLSGPMFVPRTSDNVPKATLTGPTGEKELTVVESIAHDEFGERWAVELPAWSKPGDYEVAIGKSLVYKVHVRKARGVPAAEEG